jgi:Mg-chelatase subunit ChlD
VAPLDSPLQMNFAPGRRFADVWNETESSRSPEGSTPLELAMRIADMAIERGCGLGLLDDRFRVVLVTDGQPTCSDDTKAVVSLAAEWQRIGVETWVMGLPGSEAAVSLLDAIAAAGGTEKAQLLGTPSALDETFAAAAR